MFVTESSTWNNPLGKGPFMPIKNWERLTITDRLKTGKKVLRGEKRLEKSHEFQYLAKFSDLKMVVSMKKKKMTNHSLLLDTQ